MSESIGSTTAPPAPIPVPPLATAQEPQTFSREYVHELREEAKQWRQKVQSHETAVAAAKEAADKAKAEAEKAVSEARSAADSRVIRAELKAAAVKAGIIDLDGLRILDTSEVKLDEHGEVVIPDGFFETARKNKPWLFQATSSQVQNPPRQEPPKKKTARDMDEAELRAFERQFGIRV